MNTRKVGRRNSSDDKQKHIDNLRHIFPKMPRDKYPTVCRLEAEAHRAAERYCSYPCPENFLENMEESVLRRLDAILHFRAAKVPVFVNKDPRGYALKIDDEYARGLTIYKDWGGYGILCPRF